MKTEKIKVSAGGKGRMEAINAAEEFAYTVGLSEKYILRFRLLAEEAIGMLQGIVDDFIADFYMENANETYYIILEADANMDKKKRKELIAVSTSGKNEAAQGVMGKIRELFTAAMDSYEETCSMGTEYSGEKLNYGMMGMADSSNLPPSVYYWSLNRYSSNVSKKAATDKAAAEAYDELEKSIVANLADDIKVGVRGDKVRVVLETSFDTIQTTKKARA